MALASSPCTNLNGAAALRFATGRLILQIWAASTKYPLDTPRSTTLDEVTSTFTDDSNVYEPYTTTVAEGRRVNNHHRYEFDKKMCVPLPSAFGDSVGIKFFVVTPNINKMRMTTSHDDP
ncbi:hypothetical protein TRIUR3_31629 [Triticum urartu]|uniref:Uncharacterized protein n=1 Tax=Triticum urartu TaxID=4572 RepID=M8AJB0_TRIUA|nr:hypothetical protein TRIUR3_31629 [Triticum urartu]